MPRKLTIEATAAFRCGHTVTVCNITPAQSVRLKQDAKVSLCAKCQNEADWQAQEARKGKP